ncbi:hypothetical protein PybrP1_008948 [[Pythium] brassicae (nom. inval.)]|nr:hypothetical protein PybrP1_008948 [[Pythium] brassicae (nom. inval.)]
MFDFNRTFHIVAAAAAAAARLLARCATRVELSARATRRHVCPRRQVGCPTLAEVLWCILVDQAQMLVVARRLLNVGTKKEDGHSPIFGIFFWSSQSSIVQFAIRRPTHTDRYTRAARSAFTMKFPLLLAAAVAAVAGVAASAETDKRCFPTNFLFGSATAAYQVEGAWNEGGRTPSIWDDFCRERKGVQCSNVADDFYHRYRDDIKLMVASGLDSFRFSISWSRVMNWDAQAKKMKPNAPGIAFYHAVLDELARNGITPILTLYHWDLPSELHTQLKPQGWLNPVIADHFAEYADLMFAEFGAKVELWTTFNEPLSFTSAGYATGVVTDCSSAQSTVKCSSLSLGWERDMGVDQTRAPAGARLSSLNDLGKHNCAWFTGYPAGYLDNIKWMHAHDPKADILLTENGWCGNDTVDNQDQLWYHQTYLEQVYRAITEFKIPVIGYTAWSFLDNYEWGSFKPRFGLYYVNFTAATGSKDEVTPDASALARIPRPAAKWYAQVAKARCLDVAGADSATVAVAAPSSHSSVGIAAAVVAVVVAVPAVAWLVKRRQAGSAAESTPLIATRALGAMGATTSARRALLLLLGSAVMLAEPGSAAESGKRCFPDGFLFGSATAAYQVEGAWDEGGRTPSIWDDFCREKPGLECANVADDFYHRYRDDIKLMVDAGLDTFRFSISWSRVMNWDAAAKKMKPNAPGIAFYHALVDELNRSNVKPIVTLYHWDLPSELHTQVQPQGWLNPAIADHFLEYAELMFAEFGPKIDLWSTFNEPWTFVVTDCSSPASKVKCRKQSSGWERDLGIDETRPPPGARLSSLNDLGKHNCAWFTGYSPGYLETIKWMHAHDPKADILLTENGWCGNETIDNLDQLWYYQTYIGEVHTAITELKIPVIGYSAWSFLDNYEWGSFKPRFGLYYVNFTAATGSKDEPTPKATDLARIPRVAAKWYAQVAKTKCLDGFEIPSLSPVAAAAAAVTTPERLHESHPHSEVVTGLLICVVFATPALVWMMKRRRVTRRALPAVNEATPLVRSSRAQ